MGKSAKFYKKPSLKEKQVSTLPLISPKVRSSISNNVSLTKVATTTTTTTSQVTLKAEQKRAKLQAKTKHKQESNNAVKPLFRSLQNPLSQQQQQQEIEEEEQEDNDDEEMQGDQEKLKRRPRTKQRKDWGPMPKEMGIDYLGLWHNKAK